MPRQHNYLSLALLTLAVASQTSLADTTKDIEDALKFGGDGGVKIDARYRYENVEQNNVLNTATGKPAAIQPNTANGETLRLRVGLLSPSFHGFQGYAEYSGTYSLLSDYNNGRNSTQGNKPQFSAINDPTYNRMNQLWVSYKSPDAFKTVIKGGRQEMAFDDQRFIGTSPFRQNEVVLDGIRLTNTSVKNLTINLAYIGSANTILGTTAALQAPVANVKYSMGDYGDAIAYGYWLGYTQPVNYSVGKSSQTYGIRFVNSDKPKKFFDHYSLLYTAEWSLQKSYINSPVTYQVDRWNLMGGFTAYMFSFQGAMEQLGGHGVNQTFYTPLGSNHGFQGWVDIFAGSTPANGIRDVFGTVSAKFWNDSVELSGIYHAYSDDTGNLNYGKEYDFQAVKKFGKHYQVSAIYGNYIAGSGSKPFSALATDTQKVWLGGSVNF